MMTAMVCAGAVTAQFIGGKATRDALFLASLDYTALPTMVIATSVFSILLVGLNSRAARSISPSTLVPISFAVSGAGFLLERLAGPPAAAAAAGLLPGRAPAPAAPAPRRGDRLPAYLRHRAAARIRILADLERALRPSD